MQNLISPPKLASGVSRYSGCGLRKLSVGQAASATVSRVVDRVRPSDLSASWSCDNYALDCHRRWARLRNRIRTSKTRGFARRQTDVMRAFAFANVSDQMVSAFLRHLTLRPGAPKRAGTDCVPDHGSILPAQHLSACRRDDRIASQEIIEIASKLNFRGFSIT